MGKSSINGSFSMAMLNNQSVCHIASIPYAMFPTYRTGAAALAFTREKVPPPPTPDTDMEAAEEHEEGWESCQEYTIVLYVCMYILLSLILLFVVSFFCYYNHFYCI